MKLLKAFGLAVIAAMVFAHYASGEEVPGAAAKQTPAHASGAQGAVGQPPAGFDPLAGFTIPKFENLPTEARPAARAVIEEEIRKGFEETAKQKAATDANTP